MKAIKHRFWICIGLALLVLAVAVVGCKRPDIVKPGVPAEPPEIPPLSTFLMDFGDFVSMSSMSLNPNIMEPRVQQVSFISQESHPFNFSGEALGERKNWGFAVLNVGFWSAIVVVGLAIPVATFMESFNHIPEQQPDYTWIWSYTVNVQGTEYSAELHGKYIEQGVRWDMYITKKGEYENFHWYYGESVLPATEGYWILRNNPYEPSDLLRIDWHSDLAEGTTDIKYTNIIPGGPENGGYISYGTNTKKPYDYFYDIYNKGKNNHTYIEWNGETKEGRVKDSNHFGDSDWHCWDSDFMDAECP